jgi:uncharacterized protein DUF6064
MSEWWTYSLSDFLLFSPRTYYRLFELYNAAIWPLQILALASGAAIFVLLLTGVAWRGRAIAAIAAACWLWVAWAYLFERYDTINWAASYFAAGFLLEALLLSWTGLICDRLGLRSGWDLASMTGRCMFLFALVGYPLIGPLAGRPWTQAEIFGVAPDPTAIATLGVLAAAHQPHWPLLVIPLIWCAISAATLWTMQSPDAVIIVIAVALALVAAGWKSLPRLRQASRLGK